MDLGPAAGARGLTPALATLPEEPAERVLLIVPGDGARASVPAATVVAGLPLVRRIAMAGSRAGFDRVVVHGLSVDGALAGVAAEPLAAARARRGARRLVLLPANVVPRADWLRALRSAPIQRDTLYVDASGAAVIEPSSPDGVFAAIAGSKSAGELIAGLRRRFREAAWPADQSGRFVLTGQQDLAGAETWLLRSLIKPTEGFMSRHVERRISLALTRRLVGTRVTPNAMTAVSLGFGLLGAPFFLSARPELQVVGALLFLTHSILDGCDGELARLKFLESRYGALLDFWGDNAVHVAVFLCMALGWSASAGAAWPLAVGAVAVAATIGAAYLLTGRGPSGPGSGAWLGRLTETLANRDFIYAIIILAAFGHAWWFLAVVAIGTPIFALCVMAARPRSD